MQMPDLEPVGQPLPPPSNLRRDKPKSVPKPRARDEKRATEPRREPDKAGHIDEYA